MATEKILVDIDPMAILLQEKREKSRQNKIEKTGLTEFRCNTCGNNRDIGEFDIRKTGINSYRPFLRCMPCRRKHGKVPKRKKGYKDHKATIRKSAKKAVELITDAYIKRLYLKEGFKAKDVTPEMITIKRNYIKEIRRNARDNPWYKKKAEGYYKNKERTDLSDAYVIYLIKRCTWYKGEEITKEMIQDKKNSVIQFRIMKEIRAKAGEKKPYTFFVPNSL